MRTDSETEVTTLRPGDTDAAGAVARLLNEGLGEGMYRVDRLLADAADSTAAVWLARRPRPAGAAVARLLIPEDAEYYERFGAAATSLFAGSVGSFEALAVTPAFRRHGIAAMLTEAALEWMRGQGCSVAVTISWLSGRPDASLPLFRRLGFTEGETVERFYYDESVRDGWSCPVCRGPCTCGATLFTLRLTDRGRRAEPGSSGGTP